MQRKRQQSKTQATISTIMKRKPRPVASSSSLFPKLHDEHLLQSIMEGNSTETVENYLNYLSTIGVGNDWRLILTRQPGIESHNDRTWKAISPLEFVAWSGDIFMLNMLLKHIPENKLQLAVEQLKAVRDQGTEHGKALDAWRLLIESYQVHCKTYNKRRLTQTTHEASAHMLVYGIGARQKELPLYGLQEFCDVKEWTYMRDAERVSKIPHDTNFNYEVTRECMLLNDLGEDYYHLDFTELGKSFYLDHVIDRDVPNFTRPWSSDNSVGDQAKVVKYLYEQRMQFLNDKINALEEQLEKKIDHHVRKAM